MRQHVQKMPQTLKVEAEPQLIRCKSSSGSSLTKGDVLGAVCCIPASSEQWANPILTSSPNNFHVSHLIAVISHKFLLGQLNATRFEGQHCHTPIPRNVFNGAHSACLTASVCHMLISTQQALAIVISRQALAVKLACPCHSCVG